MATAQQVTEFRQANQTLAALAQRQLHDFWSSMNLSGDPTKVRDALLSFYPDLITSFGDTAAVLGADFYDELRNVPASAKSFRAGIAGAVPDAQAAASARWAIGPLFDGDPVAAFSNLTGVTQRLVLQPGRDSVSSAAFRDPVRTGYARVPTGPTTCRWCVMLASRGAVYADARKAGEGNKYHGRCDCVPTPIRSLDDYPEGYDRKEYERLYQQGSGLGRDLPDGQPNPAPVAAPVQEAAPKRETVRVTQPKPDVVVDPPSSARKFEAAADANRWGAEKMLDVKTLPKDQQEQIRLYTGGGYRGTNNSLRQGRFSGSNGVVQKEMVTGLDKAMKASVLPETVVTSRAVFSDAFTVPKGKSLSDLSGTIYSDKGYMSTALGKTPSGSSFKGKNVSMEITVPEGTHALWTRPVSQFKGERELLLDRGANLAIESVEQNSRTGQWLIKATVLPARSKK